MNISIIADQINSLTKELYAYPAWRDTNAAFNEWVNG